MVTTIRGAVKNLQMFFHHLPVKCNQQIITPTMKSTRHRESDGIQQKKDGFMFEDYFIFSHEKQFF